MHAESILIVDDEHLLRWSLKQQLTKESYPTFEAANVSEALEVVLKHNPDLIILDQRLPDGTGIDALRRLREMRCASPVIFLTAHDRSDIAVQAIKLGAYDYLTKPVNTDEFKLVIQKALEESRVRRQLAHFLRSEDQSLGMSNIVGISPAIMNVRNFVKRIAQAYKTTVLITGESGTGKELIARAIHHLGPRNNNPFMAVNCSAISEHLVENEFFGHEKGSFTDADAQQKGIFELADGGTVFLDEIGEMSPSLQVTLLRVIEEKSFRRVGGSIDISVDVRIIAATNQRLEKRVDENLFREDLFYRLNVASIHVPPLRERDSDVILVAEHFLQQFNIAFHKKFRGLSDETKRIFREYHWPGNIREVRNVLERAILLNDAEYIQPDHIEVCHFTLDRKEAISADSLPVLQTGIAEEVKPEMISLVELEREAILNALKQSDHNQSMAARLLKVSRDTLRYRMRKHGIL